MQPHTQTAVSPVNDEYVHHVAEVLRTKGFAIEQSPEPSADFDFIATKPGERIAVRAKHSDKAVGTVDVRRFRYFVEGERGAPFTQGWLITSNRLSTSGLRAAGEDTPTKFEHWWCKDHALLQTTGVGTVQQRHVGVFTYKGGVGKSTISLLLGCALSARNHDVVLMDLNPAQNVFKLVGGTEIHVQLGAKTNAFLSVFGLNEIKAKTGAWKGGDILNAKYIVYDCPQFFTPANSAVLSQFELIVSPIGLTPFDIGVDHSVLVDTVAQVRKVNAKAPIVFVVNGLKPGPHYQTLRTHLIQAKAKFTAADRVFVLDPENCAIPFTRDIEEIGMDAMLTREQRFKLVFSTLMAEKNAAAVGIGKLVLAVKKILP